MENKKLKPTLGLFNSTVLAISIVVGAGMLVLPGLVYKAVGNGAFWSWAGDTIVAIPLLWIFVRLGKLYPSAGGVSGFVAALWPRAKLGISVVLLGTFSLGIPAIALTGSQYLLEGVGLPSTSIWASFTAFLLLSVAATIVFLGAKLASGWQNIIVSALLIVLSVLTLATVPNWGAVHFPIIADQIPLIWQGMALAFFSYTGWEMFASIAEDMKDPQRDFPRAVLISFALISALYLGAALAVESTVPLTNPNLIKAPFLPVVAHLIGDAGFARQMLGVIVVVIIFSNLVGAVWAASRMLFDLGRSTEVGSRLKLDVVHSNTSSPRRAVLMALLIFAGVLTAHAIDLISISKMLWLAGQNFFVLYTVCAIVFFLTAKVKYEKLFALLSLGLLFVFGSIFSWGLIYPFVLFVVPYGLSATSSKVPQS